jgi:hypothetical protein
MTVSVNSIDDRIGYTGRCYYSTASRIGCTPSEHGALLRIVTTLSSGGQTRRIISYADLDSGNIDSLISELEKIRMSL